MCELIKEEKIVKPHEEVPELPRDTLIRWTSSYSLLKMLNKYKVPIDKYQTVWKKNFDITNTEWSILSQLQEVLKPCMRCTWYFEQKNSTPGTVCIFANILSNSYVTGWSLPCIETCLRELDKVVVTSATAASALLFVKEDITSRWRDDLSLGCTKYGMQLCSFAIPMDCDRFMLTSMMFSPSIKNFKLGLLWKRANGISYITDLYNKAVAQDIPMETPQEVDEEKPMPLINFLGEDAVSKKSELARFVLHCLSKNMSTHTLRYINLDSYTGEMSAMEWWHANEKDYPVLAELAKNYLASSASSSSCERLCSTCTGNLKKKFHLSQAKLIHFVWIQKDGAGL